MSRFLNTPGIAPARTRVHVWLTVCLFGLTLTFLVLLARGRLDTIPIEQDKLVTVEGRLDEMQLYHEVRYLAFRFGWSRGECGDTGRCQEQCRIAITANDGTKFQFRSEDAIIRGACRAREQGQHIALRHSGPGNFFSVGHDIYAITLGPREIYTYDNYLQSLQYGHRFNFAAGTFGLLAVGALAVWGLIIAV